MSVAATGQLLAPTDIRRLLRDPSLGTATATGLPGGIASMPNLRRIAQAQGWARALPVGAAAIGGDSLATARFGP